MPTHVWPSAYRLVGHAVDVGDSDLVGVQPAVLEEVDVAGLARFKPPPSTHSGHPAVRTLGDVPPERRALVAAVPFPPPGLVGTDEIAAAMYMSRSTVRKHLENIYERLGVTSRAAAVGRAFATANS